MEKRKRQRLRIGIDLDSTLNKMMGSWLRLYNSVWDDDLELEEIVDWDLTAFVKPECGRKIYDLLKEPGFFRHQPIRNRAKEVTEYLSEHHDIYIVTASLPENCLDKALWVQEYLPHIPADHVIHAKPKFLLSGLDLLIDDGPHNILSFPNRTITIDMPWNRDLAPSYPRARNWEEVYQLFKKLESE